MTVTINRKTRDVSEMSERCLVDVMLDEREHKISGGIYNKLQVDFAFNSNHIEGSTLSHDQTRYIFDTHSLSGDNIKVNDVLETINHFRCFDFVLDTYNEELTEAYIKKLHLLLKNNTLSAESKEAVVGDYKKYANEVGDIKTTSPAKVSDQIKKLINKYYEQTEHSIEDIVRFHVAFEKIHPFFDGNGRVGRLLMFKECLKYDIVPFIVNDKERFLYYKGLSEAQLDNKYQRIIEFCLLMQDDMKAIFNYFEIDGVTPDSSIFPE